VTYDDEHTLAAIENPKLEGFLRKTQASAKLFQWIQYLTAPDEETSILWGKIRDRY
jgi:hypothetical protein